MNLTDLRVPYDYVAHTNHYSFWPCNQWVQVTHFQSFQFSHSFTANIHVIISHFLQALGCLLHEVCSLKPAFSASNLVSLFYMKYVTVLFKTSSQHWVQTPKLTQTFWWFYFLFSAFSTRIQQRHKWPDFNNDV